MGKELDKKLIKWQNQNYEEVKNGVSQFRNDEDFEKISLQSSQNMLLEFLSEIRKEPTFQSFTDEDMQEKCFKIRANVKEGMPNNAEINLMVGIHRYQGCKYDLCNVIIKAVAFDSTKSMYLYLKKGDALQSLIFIGGEDAQAFLVTKDDNNISYIRLSEFYLLSVVDNPNSEREVGLITSYSWLAAKIYSSIILGPNLEPVKLLLLSEALRLQATEKEKSMNVKEGDTDESKK